MKKWQHCSKKRGHDCQACRQRMRFTKFCVCCYAKRKIEKSTNSSTSVSYNFFNIFAKPHDCEVRAAIKFLNAENVPATEIYCRICAVYGKQNIMSLRHVYKLVQRFEEGVPKFTTKNWSHKHSLVENSTIYQNRSSDRSIWLVMCRLYGRVAAKAAF